MKKKTLYMETTGISVNKTIGEIQSELAQYGAKKIIIDYENGSPEGLIFSIDINNKETPFRLPCRWKAVYELLLSKIKRCRDKTDYQERAKKIAWRQIYRWIQSQLALINTEMVSIREIFLPFQLCKNQNTIFENIISNQTKMIDFKENESNE